MKAQVIFINIFTQLVYFIGVVFVVGILMYLLHKAFYKMIGNKRWVCYATGFIGTPIHELSHALMCIIFFHKIKEIKFFQIDSESGTMGYVNHSHNPKNIYQVTGNYFIGTAPLFVGTAIIFFMIKFMFPETSLELAGYFENVASVQAEGVSLNLFTSYANAIVGMFFSVISAFLLDWKWLLFIIVALCISIHMNLSIADIKNSIKALPVIVGIIAVFNLVFGFLMFDYYLNAVEFINWLCGYFSSVLLLSLVLSLLAVIFSVLIWGVKNILKKIFSH